MVVVVTHEFNIRQNIPVNAVVGELGYGHLGVVEDVRVAQARAGPDRAPLADDRGVDRGVLGDGRVRPDERVVPDFARPAGMGWYEMDRTEWIERIGWIDAWDRAEHGS